MIEEKVNKPWIITYDNTLEIEKYMRAFDEKISFKLQCSCKI